jgi:hypothetical protein
MPPICVVGRAGGMIYSTDWRRLRFFIFDALDRQGIVTKERGPRHLFIASALVRACLLCQHYA